MAAPAAAVVRLPVATSKPKVRLSYCVETCSMPACCYTGAIKLLITQGGAICMCVLALHMCVSSQWHSPSHPKLEKLFFMI